MPSLNFLTFGTDTPPAAPTPLRAGPLTLVLDGGDLRYVRLGGREVIRRLYAAVRDQDWGTVPGLIADLRVAARETSFEVSYTSEHRRGDIHFVWRAEITGDADGTIRFAFDGEAKTTFRRNRIGFCVLHPIAECARARCRARHGDGTGRELAFPEVIAAEQPVPGLHDLAGLAHEVAPGVWVELAFAGDAFETEDQRNWIDASFKTFCTPLRLPRPVEIQAGTRVRQTVELRPRGDAECGVQSAESADTGGAVRLSVGPGWVALPALGFGLSSGESPLDEPAVEHLTRLHAAHLRCDVKLAEAAWPAVLRRAAHDALELGAALELAVHLPAAGGDLAAVLTALTQAKADVARLIVFRDGQKSTTPADLAAARAVFADLGVPLGAGTNADLYQLNLQRPPADADFIAWSMNPQVHAFDNASIAETPAAAAQQVASVKTYFAGVPLVVSPITLRPRFNPVAPGPAPPVAPGELPPPVDPRQMTLFGAAWTLGMLAALAPAGLASLTFFETTGWRGVLETAAGSPLPEQFPSEAGQVFPLWHVFRALAGFREVAPVTLTDPLRVAALAARDASGRHRLLLANLSPGTVPVELALRPAAPVRVLEGANVVRATRDPGDFWRTPGQKAGGEIELTAHAVAFVDFMPQ